MASSTSVICGTAALLLLLSACLCEAFTLPSRGSPLRGAPGRPALTRREVVYQYDMAYLATVAQRQPVTGFYYFPECKFCQKVFDWAKEKGVDLEAKGVQLKNIKDASGDPTEFSLELLAKAVGNKQVPALEIGGQHIMKESGDIIALLSKLWFDEEVQRQLNSGPGIKVESYMEIADLLD
ncbi:unnamed protein product [Vitrella brassicaformis CCMP3155]|uniref:GST N-terminal domain-containing protein n=2 Tax=Vitrella brassicaformis TaxID=1169539 RepID=A0A0G4FHV6_VITBC|nr:unnamed protein product [Vitrella brassicaformis CCMP3155]|mmetsp:Transcript_42022/g.104919  ORF Transcript_42022/g.104919 Transcript_42022/m.104919 type:complete len:181 (+) Transcript_42022:131-673(+)|eukprot:CEM12662.1 unnamed protein product [Vitrella brassicaformis CCMP3155]